MNSASAKSAASAASGSSLGSASVGLRMGLDWSFSLWRVALVEHQEGIRGTLGPLLFGIAKLRSRGMIQRGFEGERVAQKRTAVAS